MVRQRVLIVSDSPDRRAYLEYHVRNCDLNPIWYPNILAARMAVRAEAFVLVTVDLSIPVQPKLELIRDCLEHQSNAVVVSVGKIEYLNKAKPLPEVASIIKLSSIESVPVLIKAWIKRFR